MFYFALLICLSSYDWYHPVYGPLMMYAGVLIALIGGGLTQAKIRPYDLVQAVMLAAIPISQGSVSAAYLSAVVGLSFCSLKSPLIANLVRWVVPLLVLHLSAFYVLLMLAQFDIFVNVTEPLGLMPQRTHYAHNYRPSGLLLEPNSLCVFLFLLSFIATRLGADLSELLKLSILVAILLSQSLWGVGLLPFIIFLLYPNIRLQAFARAVLVISPAFVLIAFEAYERIIRGLSGEELSFIIRLGSLETASSRTSFFGEGFDYVDWASPSIFLAWLLIKPGIVWAFPFIAFIINKVGVRLALLLLVPLFFTQPLLSNFLFWLALSRFGNRKV